MVELKEDELEEWGERMDREIAQREGGGGGGGGKKKKVLSPEAKRRIKARIIENSKLNVELEREKVGEKWDIDTILDKQLKRDKNNADMVNLRAYLRWVVSSLENGLDIKENEAEFIDSRSGGPGGQNVNKVSTAVEYRHKVSGISGESSEMREQSKNKTVAYSEMAKRLGEHLNQWKARVGNGAVGAGVRKVVDKKVKNRLKKMQEDGYLRVMEEIGVHG